MLTFDNVSSFLCARTSTFPLRWLADGAVLPRRVTRGLILDILCAFMQ